jgi:hypothetical protein
MVAHSSDYFSFNEVGITGRFFIAAGGNVGIKANATSYLFEVDGGTTGGDILCYDIFTHDGNVETSDERLKEDIVTSALGLDFVNALNPVSYK